MVLSSLKQKQESDWCYTANSLLLASPAVVLIASEFCYSNTYRSLCQQNAVMKGTNMDSLPKNSCLGEQVPLGLLGNTPELAASHLLWYGWIINLNLVLIVGKESVVCPAGEGMQKLSSLPHRWPRDICVSFPKTFLSWHWVLCDLKNLGKKRLLVMWFLQTLVILVVGPYTQTHLDLEP